MPKCKNDPTKNYKGNEPSPKGLGICAHAEKIGKRLKGKDGNIWIIKKTKNGIKRWVKFKRPSPSENAKDFDVGTKKKGGDGNMWIIKENKNGVKKWVLHQKRLDINDKKNKKKKTKVKKSKKIHGLDFFDVQIIRPNKIKKYIDENKILHKVVNKIKPLIEKNNINVYLIPLPLSERGIYWTDFAGNYIEKYYDDNYWNKSNIIITIYLTYDLKIEYEKNIQINYYLSIEEMQKVYDIFAKYLPYNYYWDGNDLNTMLITHKKQTTKIKKIKIEYVPDYPKVYLDIDLKPNKNKEDNLLNIKDPLIAKEFELIFDLEKNVKFIDYKWNITYINFVIFGIKDLKILNKLLKKLRKLKTLTLPEFVIKIKKVKAEYFEKNTYRGKKI